MIGEDVQWGEAGGGGEEVTDTVKKSLILWRVCTRVMSHHWIFRPKNPHISRQSIIIISISNTFHCRDWSNKSNQRL